MNLIQSNRAPLVYASGSDLKGDKFLEREIERYLLFMIYFRVRVVQFFYSVASNLGNKECELPWPFENLCWPGRQTLILKKIWKQSEKIV